MKAFVFALAALLHLGALSQSLPFVSPGKDIEMPVYGPLGLRQTSPKLASTGDGSLAVWLESNGISFSLIAPTGVPQSPAGRLNVQYAYGANNISVTANGASYLVVWENTYHDLYSDVSAVFGLRIGRDGGLMDSSPIRIATGNGLEVMRPVAASDGTNFIIVWQKAGFAGKHNIEARRLLGDGTFAEPVPLPITSGPTEKGLPTVAGRSGAYLLAWLEPKETSLPTINTVVATLLDPQATSLSWTNVVLATTLVGNEGPTASAGGSGFLVTWLSTGPERIPNISGVLVGSSNNWDIITPVPFPPQIQAGSHIAAASDGSDFIVLWQNEVYPQFPFYSLQGARIQAEGRLTMIDPDILNHIGYQANPAATFDGQAYSIAWESSSNGGPSAIYGFRLTPDSKPASVEPVLIAGHQNRQQVYAATETSNGYAVVWNNAPYSSGSSNAIHIALFGQGGQPLSDPVLLAIRSSRPIQIALASFNTNLLVVWSEQDGITRKVNTFSQLADGFGRPIGPTQTLISNGASTAMSLAAGNDGWLLAVATNSQIRAFKLNPDGTLANTDGLLLTPTSSASNPVITSNGQEYLVAWVRNSPSSGICIGRVSATGKVVDPDGQLIASTLSAIAVSPTLSTDRTNFFLAWQQEDPTTSSFHTFGTTIVPDFQVAPANGIELGSGTSQQLRSIASDGSRFLVTWEQERLAPGAKYLYISQALVNSDGAVARHQQPLLPSENANELLPIALGRNGAFMTAYLWQDAEGNSRIRTASMADTTPLLETSRIGRMIVAGGTPVLACPEALLLVATNIDFDHGSLSAILNSTASSNTRLSVLPDSTPGQTVTVDGNLVGNANGPVGEIEEAAGSLTIRFTTGVSPALVQTILRRLAVQTPVANPGSTVPAAEVRIAITQPDGTRTPPVLVELPIVSAPLVANPIGPIVVQAGTPIHLQPTNLGSSLTYRWLIDGVPMGSSDRPDLIFPAILPWQAGHYTLIASNAAGSATNEVADVTVLPNPPTIGTQPVFSTSIPGASAFLRVEASGNLPLRYQWQHDGTNVPGATSPFLRLGSTPDFDGIYRVIVYNASASVTSTPATLLHDPNDNPPKLLRAQTWGNPGVIILGFDKPIRTGATLLRPLEYELEPAAPISRALLDPADPERIILLVPDLDTYGNYSVSARRVGDNSSNAAPVTLDRHLVTQSLLGSTVPGYQDDFISTERDPRWTTSGSDAGTYIQHDGRLSISTADGDPNHLLFVSPAYDPAIQDVLARVRVVQMDPGDAPRVGIATSVNRINGLGINLLARERIAGTNTFELLNDQLDQASGPTNAWIPNQWYWMRLHRQSVAGSSSVTVAAKVWPADGSTPEPAIWAKWQTSDDPLAPTAGGAYAGLTASSLGTKAAMDVDYVLISADGLPLVQVAPSAFTPALRLTSLAPDGTIHLNVSGLSGGSALIQKSSDLTTWTDFRTITLHDSPSDIVDSVPTTEPSHFYRVLIQ